MGRENSGRLHSLFTSLGIGILMLKAIGQPFIKLTRNVGKERRGESEAWEREKGTLSSMAPKISEAKTPPLRKPQSLFPFFPCTLTLLSSLPYSKHLFVPHTQRNHCFTLKSLLRQICISVLSLLSDCSKFKHAYGGRMCLWSPCASPQRELLCLSFSILLPLGNCSFSLCYLSYHLHLSF